MQMIDSVYGGFADLNSAFFTPRSYTLTTNFGAGTYTYAGTSIKDILVNFVSGGQITAQSTAYTPQPSVCASCQSQVFAKDHKGCFALSGNVYNDVNGLNASPINTVDGIPINNPNGVQLYANLLNAANEVVGTVAVSPTGTYLFEGIGAATYSVQLSTTQGVVGQPMPATSLPTGWVNTGENLGATAGNDGAVNGLLPNIVVTNTNVTNANFGIEHRPTANIALELTQFNPAGTINITVDPLLFGGTDLNSGTIDSLLISTFPANITTITINGIQYTSMTWPSGGVVVPTNSTGQPIQVITFDPLDSVSSVIIPYYVYDNAGVLSDMPGNVELPLTTISLTGNVFNDANGLNDIGGGIVNGSGTNITNSLFAILVNASGNVVANSDVSSTGQYSFAVGSNTNYTVVLSTTPGVLGSPVGSPSLPPTWHNVGENIGIGIGNDGTANGTIPVSVLTTNITNVNFGIDQEPNSTDYTTTITTASLGIILPLDGTSAPTVISVIGNDPESGSLGTTNTVVFTSLPTNAVLEYNGNLVILNTQIPNFDSSLLTITLNTSGSTSTSFMFAFVDPAGIQDPTPATYTITWTLPLPVTFISFTGRSINHSVNKLNWKVAYEKDLNYYEVQKSTNAIDYITIGNVDVNNTQNYEFTDLKAFDNTNYYRLKSVDFDSKIQLSSVVILSNNNASKMITIYPNPANDQLSIQFNSTKIKSFDIVEAAGRKISFIVNDKNIYNIGQLASGIYEIIIPGFKTVKFVKR
jgi:hypothetical protein